MERQLDYTHEGDDKTNESLNIKLRPRQADGGPGLGASKVHDGDQRHGDDPELAAAADIRKAYFMSRDGYTMKLAFDVVSR